MEQKHKVIIDTDPGIDDALAILLAVNHPEIELLGLTTVFGNLATEGATANALTLLEQFGHPHIPVAEGEKKPLQKILTGYADFVHGANGLGNHEVTASLNKASDLSAAEFIVEQVMKYPNEVTICAIAPLTNLAKALELEPKIAQLTKQVVIMGGAFKTNGNVTPVAEANIWNDPHAADMVINSSWPVTLVGLDVTMKLILDHQFMEQVSSSLPRGKLIYDISRFYDDFYRTTIAVEGFACHDATALIYITNPELFTVAKGAVRVGTEGMVAGMTILDTHMNYSTPNAWSNKPRVNACLDLEVETVKKLLLEHLH